MLRSSPINISTKTICSWTEFSSFIAGKSGDWIYRGQVEDWDLTTSLERAMREWEVDLSYGQAIEEQLIRAFRRNYRGDGRDQVVSDTLYCLSVMQHHGAPTRLLDWTYSPFVAAKFAIERGRKRKPVVWCLNGAWCANAAKKIVPLLRKRDNDATRNDSTFVPIYIGPRKKKFVLPENAFFRNERLTVQQGVFLCPGDITATFLENIRALKGWDSQKSVVKLQLEMDKVQIREFGHIVRKMNLSSAALFPGLDGIARSLCEHMFHYEELAQRGVGRA